MEKEMTVGTVENLDLSPEGLISQGIKSGLTADTMERLLAMRRELKAENAKEAFDEDMAGFQSECPIITKAKGVLNKDKTSIRYKYAPLEEIIAQTNELRKKYGFSHSFDTKVSADGSIEVICTVKHKLGHSETSSFSAPIDTESYMNKPQKSASAMTYAKRYAFVNAYGITLGDEVQGVRKHFNISYTGMTKVQADGVIVMLKKKISDMETK
jgi:hypothetical protein